MSKRQTWDPERYSRNARFVSQLGLPVVKLLAPRPGERILDLGCGDGILTTTLATFGCEVVGIDSSVEQIEAARQLGLNVLVLDGQSMTFENEFDAVFSNAALHWMKQPDQVIAGVWRALKRGGRFVAEFGGEGNIALIKTALFEALQRRGVEAQAIDPWYFPSPESYRQRLEAHGFQVNSIALTSRPTPLPTDIRDWLETFTESFTAVLAPEERPLLLEEVRVALRPALCDPEGRWTADYVRLRFAATKPGVPEP